jgi:histidinol phosphatase-like PHP family hydrolase
MIIEKGKFYLKVENGFVIDAVEYNPERSDFQLYQAPSIPSDILNRCYKLEGGKLVLDTDKHAAFLEETSKDVKIEELEAKIKELEAKLVS